MKISLTNKQRELFNNNFDKAAYEQAKQPVLDAISNAKTFEELWDNLRKYERDMDCDDNFSIIFCEVELDRSHMATSADYVGIYFAIYWDDDAERGWIGAASLYTSDTPSGNVEEICFIDPETCGIMAWTNAFK